MNQLEHRPLGLLIQQRVRFAWASLVFLRIDEALRRLTLAPNGTSRDGYEEAGCCHPTNPVVVVLVRVC